MFRISTREAERIGWAGKQIQTARLERSKVGRFDAKRRRGIVEPEGESLPLLA
jgi:hypothetical protein